MKLHGLPLVLSSLFAIPAASSSLLPPTEAEGGSSTEGAKKSALPKAAIVSAQEDAEVYAKRRAAKTIDAGSTPLKAKNGYDINNSLAEKLPLSLFTKSPAESDEVIPALNSSLQKHTKNLRGLQDSPSPANPNFTPAILAGLIDGLDLPESLNGIFKPLFNKPDPDRSPFAVGEPGLLPPELELLILFSTLNGATPADFDLVNQVCPRFEDDSKFVIDGLLINRLGYQDFFKSSSAIAGGDGISAEAPGLCTTSYLSHEEVKNRIADLPWLEVNDLTFRGNELGLFRLNSRTFEFCLKLLPAAEQHFCQIVLGVPNADHETLRPLLDQLWGDGQAPGSSFTTSGNMWNKDDFVSSAKAFLEGRNSLNLPSDATFWTIKELHMQTLGIDLLDLQVQAFQNLQGASLLLAILPESIVDDVAAGLGTSVDDVNAGKAAFVDLYKVYLEAGLLQGRSDIEITKAAIGVLDAFLFAGGASVPSTIKNGLAAYYNGLTPKGRFSMTDPVDLGVLVLETVRSFPPVLGFPYIESATGKRHAPLPGFSGYDRRVYGGDADRFRIRGDLAYYHERSLNWADSALPVDGKPFSNHICPARSMSYSMISAFWEALDATKWCVDPETPITKETGPTFWSDFTLNWGACN